MFYIISFLLVSIGIIALPLIERAGSSLILAGSIFTFGFVLTQLVKKFNFSRIISRGLLFVLLVFGAGIFFTSGNSGEWAIAWLAWYFILSFQVVSIFSSKNTKGWLNSYLLSFIQLSLSGIFTEKLLFLGIFSLYLVLSVFGFIFLLPKLEIRDKILKPMKPRLGLARWGALTTFNVFFITGLVFLALPRTQNPLFVVKKKMHLIDELKKEVDLTGEMAKEGGMSFPNEVGLGTISELKNEDKILMLIETEKPFLFKAQTFNYYNGSNWIKYGSKPVAIKVKDENINFKPLYLRKELFVKITPDKFYHQKFYIKNYSQDLILGAYPIIDLSGAGIKEIRIDHFENIYLQRKLKFGDEYEVVSLDKSYPSNYLRSLPRQYPKEIMDLYLQLPPNLDQRLMDLTSKILKYTPSNIYDELITIREYLKKHCVYNRLSAGKSPTLYDFLFNKKPGDCEYFATALALMLRYRNIPTRLVIGFSGGEFDSRKRTSIVYAKNAHAWIEVFFPNIGWLPCDATPKSFSQEQWEEKPKVLVLKPRKSLEDRGFADEGSNEGESDESAYSEQSKDSRKITEEGALEEELLPEGYYFKDKLSQRSLPEEEVVFSEEFFEKTTIPAEEETSLDSELGEEILTAESTVEEEEVFLAEDYAEDKEKTVFEENKYEDFFEEAVLSEEQVEPVSELDQNKAESKISEEDAAFSSRGDEDLEFTELASELEQKDEVVEGEPLEELSLGEERDGLASEVKEVVEETVEESKEAISLDDKISEGDISNEDVSAKSSYVERAEDELIKDEVLEEERPASLSEDFEEDLVGVDLEDEFKEDIFGEEKEPADLYSSTESSLEENMSEQEYISKELVSSEDPELAEEDALFDESLVMEDSIPLEQEMLPSQEIQGQKIILEEEILEDSFLDSPKNEDGIKVDTGLSEVTTEEEDLIPDLEIIEEEGLFEEDIILEDLPAEDLIFKEESLDQSEQVFFEEDSVLEEMVQEEYILDEFESSSVEEDTDIAQDFMSKELEEGVFEDSIVLKPDSEKLKEEPSDDAVKMIEDGLIFDSIEDETKDPLVEDILFDDDLEKFIADKGLVEVEDVVEEDFESEEFLIEDMIPEDDLTAKEIGLLFNILGDKLKEWILGFSYHAQGLMIDFIEGIFRGIKTFIYGVSSNIFNHLKNNRRLYSLSFITIIAVYFLSVLSRELIRKKRKKQQICRLFPQRKFTKEEKIVRNFYLQILDLLAKAGYKRLPNLTPREFAYQLVDKGFSISKDFYHLTNMFYRISFGQINLEAQELNKIDLIAASIREWAKEIRR